MSSILFQRAPIHSMARTRFKFFLLAVWQAVGDPRTRRPDGMTDRDAAALQVAAVQIWGIGPYGPSESFLPDSPKMIIH